jgi:sugar-specific transcriptional regulator TrmB
MEASVNIILEGLGLTKNEAIVYLTLLKKGSSTAYMISKEAKLYKANTYGAMDTLIKKNLATRQEINGKQVIKAVPPEELLNNLDKQKEKLNSILPLIQRSFKEEYEEVSVFTGIESFFDILYHLLDEEKQHLYVFDIPKYVPELVKVQIDKFHKERIKHRIKMYHIYDYDASERIKYLNKMRYTYAKQGKRDRYSLVSTLTCGKVTLIINWKENMRVVKIVDKNIAETYKNQFDLLWNQK